MFPQTSQQGIADRLNVILFAVPIRSAKDRADQRAAKVALIEFERANWYPLLFAEIVGKAANFTADGGILAYVGSDPLCAVVALLHAYLAAANANIAGTHQG